MLNALREAKQGLSTRCVHAGDERDAQGAIHAALYDHSTFAFDNTADLLDVVEGRRSLATQPLTTTHHGLAAEDRARRGIVDGMERLSVGHADDHVADRQQTLGESS